MADEASMKYSGPVYQTLLISTSKFKAEVKDLLEKYCFYYNYGANFGKRRKSYNSTQNSFMIHKVTDKGKGFQISFGKSGEITQTLV